MCLKLLYVPDLTLDMEIMVNMYWTLNNSTYKCFHLVKILHLVCHM
jgi:hypothetical protein